MGEAVGAGVGVLFNPSLDRFVEESASALDYLAVIPDRGWTDAGRGRVSRLSAEHETNTALALAVPYDGDMLDLLVPRVERLARGLGCPFLIENSVSYLTYPDEDLRETEFLNALCARAGCGLLLDLHNLHCNAVNHGFDPHAYVGALDLDNVLEIHVAGGVPMLGFHTDSHTGPVLDPVWDLLDAVLPRARRLRGVTFEFHESSFPLLGREGVLAQVARARQAIAAAMGAAAS